MFQSKQSRAIVLFSTIGILLCLAVEICLGLGYGLEKWSANSLTLGLVTAVAIGLLVIVAIDAWIGELAARYTGAA